MSNSLIVKYDHRQVLLVFRQCNTELVLLYPNYSHKPKSAYQPNTAEKSQKSQLILNSICKYENGHFIVHRHTTTDATNNEKACVLKLPEHALKNHNNY